MMTDTAGPTNAQTAPLAIDNQQLSNILFLYLFIDFFKFYTGILRLRVFYFFLKYIWNLIVKHSSNSLRLIRHTKKLHYNTSKPEIKNT